MRKELLFGIAILIATAAYADTSSYIAFPDSSEGEGVLYSIDKDFSDVKAITVKAGTLQYGNCYGISNGVAASLQTLDCYDYYMLQLDLSQLERATVKGVPDFTRRAVTNVYQGYKLSNVSDVEYCGERDNCDEIYISGFKSKQAIEQWLTALRSGCMASVNGYWLWNMESIDLVVEEARCSK